MYKPLADTTLMSMTKKQIIEQLRVAEYNFKVTEENMNRQIENSKKLLAEERKHGHWKKDGTCSQCGAAAATDSRIDYIPLEEQAFCYACGAIMDERQGVACRKKT